MCQECSSPAVRAAAQFGTGVTQGATQLAAMRRFLDLVCGARADKSGSISHNGGRERRKKIGSGSIRNRCDGSCSWHLALA